MSHILRVNHEEKLGKYLAIAIDQGRNKSDHYQELLDKFERNLAS